MPVSARKVEIEVLNPIGPERSRRYMYDSGCHVDDYLAHDCHLCANLIPTCHERLRQHP